MKPRSFMLIAGEASGDRLAAELVGALRERVLRDARDLSTDLQPLRTELAPHFCGAGGPQMQAAGVDLVFDMTQHAVIGLAEVLRSILEFRRLFWRLFRFAIDRQPEVIIGVDYGGFNLRFGKAIKRYVRRHRKEFTPWNPKLVQFVSPQVWASRPGRAWTLAENYDLLLSIFPFEKDWYARRVPGLRVEFVGHPLVGKTVALPGAGAKPGNGTSVVLLPGSRDGEVRRHLPLVTGAFTLMRKEIPSLRGRLVLPSPALVDMARSHGLPEGLQLQSGDLTEALARADLGITKSGTITMECALAGLPAVVFYRTSWPTYWIGRQLVSVPYLAMPNLLAGEAVYPEFVQHAATPERLAGAALVLMRDAKRRELIRAKLKQVTAALGSPGAITRAADAVFSLLN